MWEAGQPFSRPIWISLPAMFVNCCFQQRQILQPALSLTSPSSLYLPTGDPPHPHQLTVNAPVKFWIPVLASGAPLGVVYLQALVNLYLPARVFVPTAASVLCFLLQPVHRFDALLFLLLSDKESTTLQQNYEMKYHYLWFLLSVFLLWFACLLESISTLVISYLIVSHLGNN